MPSFKNGPSAQWRFVLIEASLRVAARRSLALPMPARENLVVGRRSAEPRAIFKITARCRVVRGGGSLRPAKPMRRTLNHRHAWRGRRDHWDESGADN